MNILQCQKKAQTLQFCGATFDLVGPGGRIKCRWLDAYMGLFIGEGEKGFWHADDFDAPDIRCENLTARSADKVEGA
jgi:hypothetical protein